MSIQSTSSAENDVLTKLDDPHSKNDLVKTETELISMFYLILSDNIFFSTGSGTNLYVDHVIFYCLCVWQFFLDAD